MSYDRNMLRIAVSAAIRQIAVSWTLMLLFFLINFYFYWQKKITCLLNRVECFIFFCYEHGRWIIEWFFRLQKKERKKLNSWQIFSSTKRFESSQNIWMKIQYNGRFFRHMNFSSCFSTAYCILYTTTQLEMFVVFWINFMLTVLPLYGKKIL
jgi:hypothetical protein